MEEKKYIKDFKENKIIAVDIMGEPWWKEMEFILADFNEDWDCWQEFNTPRIVDKPKGNKQDVESDVIPEQWVNQTTNGGYMGDEYAGTVYFKLKNEKYLELSYSM